MRHVISYNRIVKPFKRITGNSGALYNVDLVAVYTNSQCERITRSRIGKLTRQALVMSNPVRCGRKTSQKVTWPVRHVSRPCPGPDLQHSGGCHGELRQDRSKNRGRKNGVPWSRSHHFSRVLHPGTAPCRNDKNTNDDFLSAFFFFQWCTFQHQLFPNRDIFFITLVHHPYTPAELDSIFAVRANLFIANPFYKPGIPSSPASLATHLLHQKNSAAVKSWLAFFWAK